MPTFAATRAGYRNLWDRCVVRSECMADAKSAAQRILVHKAIYQDIEHDTGVPWFFIGCTHLREGDLDFGTYLGNGQSLKRVTTQVPRGRGPFSSFKAGAIDALQIQGYLNIKTWTIELVLYDEEALNGWGYVGRNENSPYIWGGTNLQQVGKYDEDNHFNASMMDTQLGVAAVLKALALLDADVAAFCKPGIVIPQPAIKEVPVTAPTVDMNAIIAAIQPQLQALIQDAIQRALATQPVIAPIPPLVVTQTIPPASSVVVAPTPVVMPPLQVTVSSTLQHIVPVLDMLNPVLARFIPPPYNVIPTALGGLVHVVAGMSGGGAATPASIGQGLEAGLQGIGTMLHGNANLPPWLQAIAKALQPQTPTLEGQ